MKIPFLDLTRQYRAMALEIDEAMAKCVESQSFILGPFVESFENDIASYCKTPYALGVSSGTDALLLAFMALGIGPGDEIITTPFTFFATAGSIARLGAKPVFVDIDERTFNLNVEKIEAAITSKTKAIMPVHLFGQCCDMESLMSLASAHHLRVVEDAAQAIGASFGGKAAGTFGDIGCFSFFPSKNLGAYGDGGMVVTADKELHERMKTLRVHGARVKYRHTHVGGNFRLDALQAAVLSAKLKHLDGWSASRRRNADYYNLRLKELPVVLPHADSRTVCVYNQFSILTDQRAALRTALTERGIGTEIYYPLPLHLQECFHPLNYHAGDFPISEAVAERILSLPIFPELMDMELDYICRSVEEALYAGV